MTLLMYWRTFLQFADAIFIYFAEFLGRSAIISVAVMAVILILRKTVLKRNVFGKGLIWGLLVPVLFVGKLKFFYETIIGLRMSWWWNYVCIEFRWVARIYMLGITVMGIYIFLQRHELKKFVRSLEPGEINGNRIYISRLSVSPFTVGLLRPKIVVPEMMFRDFGREELDMVLLHEKVHIRLGHLWLYLLWDVLRVLLWPNLLLTTGMKRFRSDIEDICDRVTIQKSRKTAYEYGSLLLKSLQLLKEDTRNVSFSVTLTGETEYRNIKSRMKRVVNFRPYKKIRTACICAGIFLFLAGSIWGIKRISYPRYTEYDSITIYNETSLLLISDSKELREAVTVDDRNVSISRALMDKVLEKNHITDKNFFVGFGGYSKLPGIGGGGNAVYVDYSESEGDLTIPYVDNDTDIINKIFKYI